MRLLCRGPGRGRARADAWREGAACEKSYPARESLFRIVVEGGAIELRPAGSWDVRGGPEESAWSYRLDEFGPSGNLTYFVPSAGVIHAVTRWTRRGRGTG